MPSSKDKMVAGKKSYNTVIFKIFEPLGFTSRIQQTRIHSIQRWRHFGAKTSWSTWMAPPLLLLNPVFLIQINNHSVLYTCQLDEIHYLEIRCHCVNTSFIIKELLGMGHLRASHLHLLHGPRPLLRPGVNVIKLFFQGFMDFRKS